MARPKGTQNRTTDAVIKLLNEWGLEPINEMAKMIQDPNTEPAIKARLLDIISRFVYPQRKAQYAPIHFDIGSTHVETCQNIISAIAEGKIPPDVGEQVLRSMDVWLRAMEFDQFESRLRQLEGRGESDS